ncbi:MAG TPA: hypothetical protein DGR97_04490, partial [Gammaproteobacteria bacterium]|nr:hypothetical protein [Gammaproteobacteria bacterium]
MRMHRSTLWLVSITSSLVLLSLIVAQVDWRVASSLVFSIDYCWVASGIALLILEGLITAARFRLLARTATSYGDCLRATACYVVMLILIPARLGEVAGVGFIVRYMHERAGAAAASLLFQRVFDVIILVTVLAAVCFLTFGGLGTLPVLGSTVVVTTLLILLLIRLEALLAVVVRPVLHRRQEKWPRMFIRTALQVRMVCRHHINWRRGLKLSGYTVLKWIVNLSAIACIVLAVAPVLTPLTAVGIGIVYNLAAVIPIQTVGGFGISEAALLGSFSWMGFPLETGAPMAIGIRLALISAPILFWLGVTLTIMISRP